MKEKKPGKIFYVLLIISLVIIIFISSFSYYLLNYNFYHQEYIKNGVYEKLGKETVQNVTSNLFNFFENKEDLKYFSPLEQAHLNDVKLLIRDFFRIYAIAIIILFISLIYFFKKNTDYHAFKIRKKKRLFDYRKIFEKLSNAIMFASLISLCLLFIFFIINLIGGFDFLFTNFHYLFFPQGNWQFPDSSLLIQLFPYQFFYDISLGIFLRTVIVSVILFFIGFGSRFYFKRTS